MSSNESQSIHRHFEGAICGDKNGKDQMITTWINHSTNNNLKVSDSDILTPAKQIETWHNQLYCNITIPLKKENNNTIHESSKSNEYNLLLKIKFANILNDNNNNNTTQSLIHGISVVIILYDIRNLKTFEKAKTWVNKIQTEIQKQQMPSLIAIIGCDLLSQDSNESDNQTDIQGAVLL